MLINIKLLLSNKWNIITKDKKGTNKTNYIKLLMRDIKAYQIYTIFLYTTGSEQHINKNKYRMQGLCFKSVILFLRKAMKNIFLYYP